MNNDNPPKVEVKGTGCLVAIWIGIILLLIICAGKAAETWGLI